MSRAMPSFAVRLSAPLLAAALAAPSPVWGGELFQNFDDLVEPLVLVANYLNYTPLATASPDAAEAAAVTFPKATTFHVTNLQATLEPDEPTEGGLMTRSIWGKLTPAQNERIVIHTVNSRVFGSESFLDTVLAVYTGPTVDALTRIAGNDNRSVPGISATQSLVQFDAGAGVTYRVQMGSKLEAEGEIYANVFRFPAGGGLSIFLAQTDFKDTFNGQDYVCELSAGTTLSCPNPKFVVHNSTDQTVSVTAATSIGNGVTPPAPFTLAPGALKTVKFLFTPGFDKTTVRTASGRFIFSAKAGTTEVSRATQRALVIVKSKLLPPLDIVKVSPTARAGFVNEPLAFKVLLKNPGPETVQGCHFRSSPFARVKTVFQRIDPATGKPIGPANAPARLTAGAVQTFTVKVASQDSRVADPEFDPPVIADCADTVFGAAFDLSSNFDLTARGDSEPSDIPAVVTSPAGGVLNVSTAAVFRVRAVNQGAARTVIAKPRYIRPFGEDDPAKQFAVSTCRINPATNKCLAPFASSVAYSAKRDLAAIFAVRVAAPAVDPGFDPGKRRVFLDFRMDDNVDPNFVGSASVAPKKL